MVGRIGSKLRDTAFLISLLHFICLPFAVKDSTVDSVREKERKSQKWTNTIHKYLNGQSIHRRVHLFAQDGLATGYFQQSFSFWMHSFDAVYKERLEKKLLRLEEEGNKRRGGSERSLGSSALCSCLSLCSQLTVTCS